MTAGTEKFTALVAAAAPMDFLQPVFCVFIRKGRVCKSLPSQSGHIEQTIIDSVFGNNRQLAAQSA